jgi:hypothetical protein
MARYVYGLRGGLGRRRSVQKVGKVRGEDCCKGTFAAAPDVAALAVGHRNPRRRLR